MLIDWFTVAAQVVNFLVLVVVLKLVLFDRVVAAMDAREAAIADRIRDAEAREADAASQAEAYRARQRELEAQRQRRLEAVEVEAAERRTELLARARSHVDGLRAGWEAALDRDRAHFLEEVRRRSGEQICTVSRRALADLADTDLETRLVEVAMRRLEEAADRLRPLRGAGGDDGEERVDIQTAFPLDDATCDRLRDAVVAAVGCDRRLVGFSQDPDLVCGLEIQVGGWTVGWSVDSYVDAMSDALADLLPPAGAAASAPRARR